MVGTGVLEPRVKALLAWSAALALLVLLATSIGPNQAHSADAPCIAGERQTVDTGIARLRACFTKATTAKGTVYTARFADQPKGTGVDLNGFIFTTGSKSSKGEAITVNTDTREVKSIGLTQMNSANWPTAGLTELGVPFQLEFTAPKDGEMVIEDMKVGPYVAFKGVLALLFSPLTNVDTPMAIGEGGKGSIGITVALAGIFTLKGNPQSETIDLATETGKGTTLDGFKFELNEIDAFKAVILENFSASYSASKEKFDGEASVRFPFLSKKPADRGGKGITAGFGIEKGQLKNLKVGATGLKLPIGTSGFLTSIKGGVDFSNPACVKLGLNMGASFGPEIPVPWGSPVQPIGVTGDVGLSCNAKEYIFTFDAGMSLFNIALGKAHLGIYTRTGVEFSAGIGVGLPSLTDNKRDPFYVNAGIAGWVGVNGFQLEGNGQFKLFGIDLLKGRAMVNQNVLGACWKIFWFEGGAVYEFRGKKVTTFGTRCGLDRYKVEFRPSASASISAAHPQSITLNKRQVIVAVKGSGGAPRFSLTSPSGEVMKAPVEKDGVRRDDNMFFVDDENEITNVALRDPAGRWTITPYPGSPPITSVRSGTYLKPEKIKARVLGSGLNRTLVWDSKGQPNTTLAFTEQMKVRVKRRWPDGHVTSRIRRVQKPIFTTGKASGRKYFRAARGLYGERRLRVIVIHGGTPRENQVVDRYTVKQPRRPDAPRKVRAWKDEQDVTVRWSKVAGATNYFVQAKLPGHKGWKDAYARITGRKARKVTIQDFPSGGISKARVVAINHDGLFGKAGHFRFRTDPKPMSLRKAVGHAARSARVSGDGVGIKTICPGGGHCHLRIRLVHGSKVIGTTRFQQTPDTYRHLRVRPISKSMQHRLAKGRLKNVRVVVIEGRNGKKATVSTKL